MKTVEQVGCEVDSWIAEEELPVTAQLKVIRAFDPYQGMDDEEIEAYRDFMSWYLAQDHSVLQLIPKETGTVFWPFEFDEFGHDVSVFNTHDFQKTLRPFDRYGYAIKKVMEQVKELAIMHSSLSTEEGRLNTQRRYHSLIDDHFRERLLALAARYRAARDEESKAPLRRKIAELTRRILEAKTIWERFAPWDS